MQAAQKLLTSKPAGHDSHWEPYQWPKQVHLHPVTFVPTTFVAWPLQSASMSHGAYTHAGYVPYATSVLHVPQSAVSLNSTGQIEQSSPDHLLRHVHVHPRVPGSNISNVECSVQFAAVQSGEHVG